MSFSDRLLNWIQPRIGNAADNLLGLAPDGSTQFDYSIRNNNEQAQINRDWQEKMFNLSNLWNSPEHQMKLMRDAGLNPALMYGQMSDLSASVPSGAQASSPSGSAGRLDSLLGLGTDVAALPAEIDLKRAQAEEIRSRIPLNQQRVNESKARVQDLFASVAQRRSTIELQSSQKQLTDASRQNISFEQSLKSGYLDLEQRKFDLLSNKTDAEIKKLNAEEKEILARAGVTERELQEMIWTYSVRRAGLEKQNLLTDANIRVANETADKLRKEGVRIDQIVSMDSVRADQAQTIMDMINSKNPLEQIGGLLLYGFEYGASHLQQLSVFK